MPRSLRIRPTLIPDVKASLLRHGFPSQRILAEQLGVAQSTISHFLNGKPVDFVNFVEICQVLAQEWREIAELETPLPVERNSNCDSSTPGEWDRARYCASHPASPDSKGSRGSVG
ncbi:hypothetical protein ACQ4M3_18255 [Leptolyngbya sp. AN03gr2]|uniref:hypothetical protein n=1 Tax=unclassified Leptolyngbya TaxID=2650499 RepID=UPI003D323049